MTTCDRANETAAYERRSDWELVQDYASKSCRCGGGVCQWWEAADDFFQRNRATIDRKELANNMCSWMRTRDDAREWVAIWNGDPRNHQFTRDSYQAERDANMLVYVC